jgi:hypothetical protein
VSARGERALPDMKQFVIRTVRAHHKIGRRIVAGVSVYVMHFGFRWQRMADCALRYQYVRHLPGYAYVPTRHEGSDFAGMIHIAVAKHAPVMFIA